MQAGQIFFSYSRVDAKFALKLAEDLRKAGIDIWIDQIDIPPSVPWDEEIQKALDESNCLLVILSKSSVASDNVLNEVNYAMETKKQVLPVLIGHDINKPFNIRRLQHIDFTSSYDAGLNQLLKSLDADAPIEPAEKHPSPFRRRLALAVFIIVLAVAAIWFIVQMNSGDQTGKEKSGLAVKNRDASASSVRVNVNGRWSTSELINPFDKNDRYRIIFDFEQMGDVLTGTVEMVSTVKERKYQRKKAFLDGKVSDSTISFYTPEQSLVGNETVNYRNLYYGSLSNGMIKFNLQSDRPWGFEGQQFTAKPDSVAR
jgi:hypothetical protein